VYEISVVSYQGAAPADRIAAVFGEDGGTIGRGSGNTLVLPDPNRFVSRLQAKVALDDGRLAITNASSANPLLVNDRELDAGASASSGDGDELRIGLYLLRVRRLHLASDDDANRTRLSMVVPPRPPTAQPSSKAPPNAPVLLEAPMAAGAVVPASVAAPAVVPARAAEPVVQALGPLDPLQLALGASGSDPFADLIPNAAAVEASRDAGTAGVAGSTSPSAGSVTHVPDDIWNDLARLAPGAVNPAIEAIPAIPTDFDAFAGTSATARNRDDPLAEFAQSGLALEAFDKLDAPIDTLFNEDAAKTPLDDVIPDPQRISDDPLGAPESVDPLVIFNRNEQSPARGFDRAEPDQVPELEAWFRPPEARFASAPSSPASTHAPAAVAATQPAPLPRPTQPPAPAGAHGPAIEPRPAPPPENQASTPDDDALLRAFLAGAGIPNAIVKEGLTPHMMKAIGAVLAASVQGTIELIAARAMLKREVKADVTIIATTKNNPLKFLPDAESALLQMFGARIPGFMAPVEAMHDAFQDLRAHEVGVIAGMRAALADVLRRFEPSELEKRLKPPGMLESLLPNTHEARLWQTFTEMYGDISREAQDDFQALFGKAFLAAYENEVARLKGA
jgi:FHA domain-containing protein